MIFTRYIFTVTPSCAVTWTFTTLVPPKASAKPELATPEASKFVVPL